ncbi:DUF421 domain-containing protein [Bacillus sp. T33-2]|uniref:DUF421 domain-containing protein n=1 Tax=Bacillus sp. T33-2 TaxID=2054168 RepID=UPI000C7849C8|nr:hypothetical protein CVD19_10745 [Bacillus sp. T33-2]
MYFFQSQETLTVVHWILRAVVSFFFMLVTVRIMGQRSISQLRLLDFVMALILGNIIAHPLSDEQLAMTGSMVTISALVFLYIAAIMISAKWKWLRHLLNPVPFVLIKDGEIIYKGLKKARISIDYLLTEVRKDKIADIKKIALALWEADGTISIFLHPRDQAVTPRLLKVPTEPFDYPRTIIVEGKIDAEELHHLNKDRKWLIDQLRAEHKTEVRNVLLATLDSKDNLTVLFYR